MIPVLYSILLSLEIIIIGMAISNAIPYPHNPLYDRLFQRFIDQSVFPKREHILYLVFFVSCIVLQGGLVLFFRQRLLNKDLTSKISQLAWAQGFWVLVEIFAAFKIYMYHGPIWAKTLFYGALGLSALHKIFWPEVYRWLSGAYASFFEARHSGKACRFGDVVTMLLIVSVFWITDWNKGLAAIAARDHGAELQHFFEVTLWGKIFGLAQAAPGMQVAFMVIVHILYFVVLFVFLRVWLKEKFVAVFGALMTLKLQCFNGAVVALPWSQPELTVLMHAWDLLFFVSLWFYLETRKPIFITAMTAACTLAIAFMPFSGICLWLAYVTVMWVSLRAKRSNLLYSQIRLLGLATIAPPLLGWGLMLLLGGQWVWPYGSSDLVQQLTDRHYFSFFFGFVVVGLYALCILERKSLWTLGLAVYGLLSMNQYALMPVPYGYEVYALPFILLVVCKILEAPIKKLFYMRLVLAAVTVAALLTNTVFLLYPNIWQSIFSL